MEWKNIQVQDAVLTLWPGTQVKESDKDDVIKLFTDVLGLSDPVLVGCVTTLPDQDASGNYIPGTGGRHDFFFWVRSVDIPKFASKRFTFDMKWWEDVYFNDGENIYPQEFLTTFPDPLGRSKEASDDIASDEDDSSENE